MCSSKSSKIQVLQRIQVTVQLDCLHLTYFVCAHKGEAWSRKEFLIFISLSREHSATAFDIIQNDTVGNHSCHVHILLFEMELNSTIQFCIQFSIKFVLVFKLKENKELQWVYSGGWSVKRHPQECFSIYLQYYSSVETMNKMVVPTEADITWYENLWTRIKSPDRK